MMCPCYSPNLFKSRLFHPLTEEMMTFSAYFRTKTT